MQYNVDGENSRSGNGSGGNRLIIMVWAAEVTSGHKNIGRRCPRMSRQDGHAHSPYTHPFTRTSSPVAALQDMTTTD